MKKTTTKPTAKKEKHNLERYLERWAPDYQSRLQGWFWAKADRPRLFMPVVRVRIVRVEGVNFVLHEDGSIIETRYSLLDKSQLLEMHEKGLLSDEEIARLRADGVLTRKPTRAR